MEKGENAETESEKKSDSRGNGERKRKAEEAMNGEQNQ